MVLESDLLTSSVMGKLFPSLYLYLNVACDTKLTRSLDRWRMDIPTLDEEKWEECVTTFIPSMIAAKDRFIQLKLLHRAYYMPQRLSHIYSQLDPKCTRCGLEVGSFWHMVWSCPKLHRPYWEAIVATLSNICGVRIPSDPLMLLLSHLEDIEGDRYSKLCLTFVLYYARREILLRWKSMVASLEVGGVFFFYLSQRWRGGGN